VILIEVFGVGLWAVLGLAGSWWLLTGRKTIYLLIRSGREFKFLPPERMVMRRARGPRVRWAA